METRLVKIVLIVPVEIAGQFYGPDTRIYVADDLARELIEQKKAVPDTTVGTRLPEEKSKPAPARQRRGR